MADEYNSSHTGEEIDAAITAVANKVDKVTGKGLSTNDYTTAEKNKLFNIAENANNYTHPANHPASIISQDENNRFVSDYDTDEHLTGTKWIDGKDIYRKVIDFGALPNNDFKAVAHGITDLDQIISITGTTKKTATNLIFTIPFAFTDSLNSVISFYINTTNIECKTGIDRTDCDATKIILEYTKTTPP